MKRRLFVLMVLTVAAATLGADVSLGISTLTRVFGDPPVSFRGLQAAAALDFTDGRIRPMAATTLTLDSYLIGIALEGGLMADLFSAGPARFFGSLTGRFDATAMALVTVGSQCLVGASFGPEEKSAWFVSAGLLYRQWILFAPDTRSFPVFEIPVFVGYIWR